MTVALSYSSVKDKSSSHQIFGLQVAVTNWLRAFMKHSTQEKFAFLIRNKEALEEIEEAAALLGIDPARLVAYDSRFPQENFNQFSTIFRTDPVAGHVLWQRALVKGPGYAFCGLSHTIAGLEVGEVLEQYCLAPTEVGDAIVCPSRAIKSVIRRFWDVYEDYLAERFGAKFKCPLELPIIPLGVDLERFERICTPDKRASQRQTLGFDENDIVVLWVGRLSSAIKAHPLSMFRAVEEAAKRTGKRVHFLMQGYFFPAEGESEFRDLANDFCKTADVQFIASDDARFPDGLWAAGDIFLSLVDNMQESFGLTPIEAIAANLPRVITDWDGYRDCVRHGVDGFLVRTIQPPAGQGQELSSLLLGSREMYGGYLAKTGLCVAVDHEMATSALVQLIENPSLRKSMAEEARRRLPDYAWKNIIPQYETLWDELAQKRQKAVANKPAPKWPAIPPQAPDPFTMYESFPTQPLHETDQLAICTTADEIRLLWKHGMNVIAMDVMPHPDMLMQIIKEISASGKMSVGEILQKHADLDQGKIWRALTWFLKLGIARIC